MTWAVSRLCATALLLAAVAAVGQASCSIKDSATGSSYDLSKLVKTSGDDWIAKDSLESDEYLYRINLCRPVLYTGNVNFTVPAETGIHQQRKDAPSRQHVVGKVGFPAVLDGVLYVDFNDGELCTSVNKTRKGRITFACVTGTDLGTPVLMYEDDCFYVFEWKSSAACATTGLSGGAIFMIVLASLVGAYVVFGFLYRRFVVGAKGWKQCPNYDLWQAVFSALFCCGRDKSVQYRQIPRSSNPERSDLLDDINEDEFEDDAVETADTAPEQV